MKLQSPVISWFDLDYPEFIHRMSSLDRMSVSKRSKRFNCSVSDVEVGMSAKQRIK